MDRISRISITTMTYHTIDVSETECLPWDEPAEVCSKMCAHLFGFCATALGLIFGILALVPASPFHEKNVGLGVSLIVLTLMMVVYCVAGLVGGCFGYCLRCLCCRCCFH